MYCAQNEEANWCNGLLEVHALALLAVMLCTLAGGGTWAQLGHKGGIAASLASRGFPCMSLVSSLRFNLVEARHEFRG